MKKLLTVLLVLTATLMANAQTVLWQTGDAAEGGTTGASTEAYKAALTLNASVFSAVEIGDKLVITTDATKYAEFYVRGKIGGSFVNVFPNMELNSGDKAVVTTPAVCKFQLDLFKANGMQLVGSTAGWAITKVELVKGGYDQAGMDNAIWLGNFALGNYDHKIKICRRQAEQFVAGGKIEVLVEAPATTDIALEIDPEGVAFANDGLWSFNMTAPYSGTFTINADFITAIVNKGIIVKGKNLTVTRVNYIAPAAPEPPTTQTYTIWQTGDATLGNTTGTLSAQYGTALRIPASCFANLQIGDKITVSIPDVAKWSEVYINGFIDGNATKLYNQKSFTIDANHKTVSFTVSAWQTPILKNGGMAVAGSTPTWSIDKIEVEQGGYDQATVANSIWIGNKTWTADWGGGNITIAPVESMMIEPDGAIEVYATPTAESFGIMCCPMTSDTKSADYNAPWQYTSTGAKFTIAADSEFYQQVKTLQSGKTFGWGFLFKGFSMNVTQIDYTSPMSTIVGVQQAQQQAVDVYSLSGMLVRQQVASQDATTGLPAGLYIVGKKKVAVK